MAIGYYDYKALKEKALAFDATQEDMANLAEWFERFGRTYWNGEYYDVGDGFRLFPIFGEETDNGDFPVIGWEFK